MVNKVNEEKRMSTGEKRRTENGRLNEGERKMKEVDEGNEMTVTSLRRVRQNQ